MHHQGYLHQPAVLHPLAWQCPWQCPMQSAGPATQQRQVAALSLLLKFDPGWSLYLCLDFQSSTW